MKRKEFIEPVEVQQVENGFILSTGSNCDRTREQHVFQSFIELVNFLNNHFTHREKNIFVDNNESLITLK
jgi:hypothetical protein